MVATRDNDQPADQVQLIDLVAELALVTAPVVEPVWVTGQVVELVWLIVLAEAELVAPVVARDLVLAAVERALCPPRDLLVVARITLAAATSAAVLISVLAAAAAVAVAALVAAAAGALLTQVAREVDAAWEVVG